MTKFVLIALSLISLASLAKACPVGGDAKAPLTIEEFADFECPYCAKGAKLMDKVLKDFPGQVRVVFRNRPLAVHAHADSAARAYLALCAQGAQFSKAFYNEVFAHQVDLETKGEAYLYEVAAQIGANVAKMKTAMVSAAVTQALRNETDEADRNAIDGVPSFIVGTEKITGAVPYGEIKRAIEKQLSH